MNDTQNTTLISTECKPPLPAALLWVVMVHGYCVMVIGTLGNALALWCVATCTKTGSPMKVLLLAVFFPTLVMCLVRQPMWGEIWATRLTCDRNRISTTVLKIMLAIIAFLQLVEVTAIAAIAVVRAAAIWAPHRPKLGIRGAVVLLMVTCIYAFLTGLVFMGVVEEWLKIAQWVHTVTDFVTVTLPVLITITAYVLMIFSIQRNKRRLVAFQQQPGVTTTMDQATRAMLAVFISNLVFWLPGSIYVLFVVKPTPYSIAIFEIIYSTHFMVDPLVYMWLNIDYRDKILSCMAQGIKYMSCSVEGTRPLT